VNVIIDSKVKRSDSLKNTNTGSPGKEKGLRTSSLAKSQNNMKASTKKINP